MDSFGPADGAHRADKSAEVTAYAFRANDTGLAGVVVAGDGLATAPPARHIAATAADPTPTVYLRIYDRVAVEVGG